VERDWRATGEHAADQYLIRRRDGQLFAAVDSKRRAAPRGQHIGQQVRALGVPDDAQLAAVANGIASRPETVYVK
jgi:hypothetical protein